MQRDYKIVDQPHLIKRGGVVMNVDQEGYQAYIEKRNEKKERQELKEEVADLKKQLAEAIALLKEVVK